MGDTTSGLFQVRAVPTLTVDEQGTLDAIVEVFDSYAFNVYTRTVDAGRRTATIGGEVSCGAAEEVAAALDKIRAEHGDFAYLVSEDPKYEWMGNACLHVPDDPPLDWSGEVDADGQPRPTVEGIMVLVNQATDLRELRAMLDDDFGRAAFAAWEALDPSGLCVHGHVMPTGASKAIGRFDGPVDKYVAATMPGAPVRATREEAAADECRWLHESVRVVCLSCRLTGTLDADGVYHGDRDVEPCPGGDSDFHRWIFHDAAGNRYHDRELQHRIVSQPGPTGTATWCTADGCDWRPSCPHTRTQQVSEHDVRCLACGVVSA